MGALSDALPDDGIPDYGQKTAAGIIKGGLDNYSSAQKKMGDSIDAATGEMRAGNNTAANSINGLQPVSPWLDFSRKMGQSGNFFTNFGEASGAYGDAQRKEREYNLSKIEKLNAIAQANAALTHNAASMHWDLSNDPITRAAAITAAGQAGGQAVLPGLIQKFSPGFVPPPSSVPPPPAATPGPVSFNEPPPAGNLTPPPPMASPALPGGATAPSMPPPPVSPADQLAGDPASIPLTASAQVAGPSVPASPTAPADASAALDPAHAAVLANPDAHPPQVVAQATQAGLHAVAQQSTPDPATMGIKGMDDWANKITVIARQHPGLLTVGNFGQMAKDATAWLQNTPSKAGIEAREKMPSEIQKETSVKAFGKHYDDQSDTLKEAYSEARQGLLAKQQAQAMMGQMFDKNGRPTVNSGPLGEHIAKFGATLQQFGVSPQFIKELTGTDPNNAAAVEKLRTDMASEIARMELQGSPVRVAEFQRFVQSTPGATLPAAAFKWLVENTILPKAEVQIQRYNAVKDLDPGAHNVRGKLFDFDQQHPWYVPGQTPPQATPAAATPAGITPEMAQAELARRRAAAGAK